MDHRHRQGEPQEEVSALRHRRGGADRSERDGLKIGLATKCDIVLPPFQIKTADGVKECEDINEWFRSGHTLEEFEALKDTARPFDVAGVTGGDSSARTCCGHALEVKKLPDYLRRNR